MGDTKEGDINQLISNFNDLSKSARMIHRYVNDINLGLKIILEHNELIKNIRFISKFSVSIQESIDKFMDSPLSKPNGELFNHISSVEDLDKKIEVFVKRGIREGKKKKKRDKILIMKNGKYGLEDNRDIANKIHSLMQLEAIQKEIKDIGKNINNIFENFGNYVRELEKAEVIIKKIYSINNELGDFPYEKQIKYSVLKINEIVSFLKREAVLRYDENELFSNLDGYIKNSIVNLKDLHQEKPIEKLPLFKGSQEKIKRKLRSHIENRVIQEKSFSLNFKNKLHIDKKMRLLLISFSKISATHFDYHNLFYRVDTLRYDTIDILEELILKIIEVQEGILDFNKHPQVRAIFELGNYLFLDRD